MIDLHCHILPGIDDGAPDIDESIAMAQVAADDGIRTIAATPHVRDDHPFDITELQARRDQLQRALSESGVPVHVEQGAEVAIEKVGTLSDAALSSLCLGRGRYLLVESPYTHALEWFEEAVYALQDRGFRPVLAHPERSPSFISSPSRVADLARGGVLCSLTAASLTGRFGRRVRASSFELLKLGLAHNIASDGHGSSDRRPQLRKGAAVAARKVKGVPVDWYTRAVPEAILAGVDPPAIPSAV